MLNPSITLLGIFSFLLIGVGGVAQDASQGSFAIGMHELEDVITSVRDSTQNSLKQIDATFLEEANRRKKNLLENLEQARRKATLADDLNLAISIRDTKNRIGDWSPSGLLESNIKIELEGNSLDVEAFKNSMLELLAQRRSAVQRATSDLAEKFTLAKAELFTKYEGFRKKAMSVDDLELAISIRDFLIQLHATEISLDLVQDQKQKVSGSSETAERAAQTDKLDWNVLIPPVASGTHVVRYKIPAGASHVFVAFFEKGNELGLDPGNDGRLRVNYCIAAARVYDYTSGSNRSGVSLNCEGIESNTREPETTIGRIEITKLIKSGEINLFDFQLSQNRPKGVKIAIVLQQSREKDLHERQVFVADHMYLMKGVGDEWIQVIRDGNPSHVFRYREVTSTPEYVEMIHENGTRVRYFDDYEINLNSGQIAKGKWAPL